MTTNRFLAALALAAAAMGGTETAQAATYTYTSPVLYLQNPLEPSGFPQTITRSYSFWFDEDYLGGTTAGATVTVAFPGFIFDPPQEAAFRNGVQLPYDFDLNFPIATTNMSIDSLRGFMRFTFDRLGDVESFRFGTDGEFASITFNDTRASVYGCTICDYTPYWRGEGPGTWTHTPVAPIPVIPAWSLMLTGLLALSALSKPSRPDPFRASLGCSLARRQIG